MGTKNLVFFKKEMGTEKTWENFLRWKCEQKHFWENRYLKKEMGTFFWENHFLFIFCSQLEKLGSQLENWEVSRKLGSQLEKLGSPVGKTWIPI